MVKKILAAALCLLLVLVFLCGCEKRGGQDAVSQATSKGASEEEEETMPGILWEEDVAAGLLK